jgi:hypothetical protein
VPTILRGVQFDRQRSPKMRLIRSSRRNRKKIVIIGGWGHVGLPLGLLFANCGLLSSYLLGTKPR